MKKYIWTALTISVFAVFSACKIGDDTPAIERDQYEFDLRYSLSNVKKTYLPGDVVFLEFSLPGKTMTDVNTGTSVRVGNARIFPTLRVINVDSFQVNNQDFFDFSVINGEVTASSDSTLGIYLKANLGCPASTSYDLKVAFTFNEPGAYLLLADFGAETPYHTFPFTDDDDCSQVSEAFISDEADIAYVQFFMGADDVNKDVFDDFEQGSAFTWDEEALATYTKALEEKRAFFVRVE